MKTFIASLGAIIIGLAIGAGMVIGVVWLSSVAHAHEWYSQKQDPMFYNGCCGGADCAELLIEPGVLTGEADGYRIRLTAKQAQRINPYRTTPVDTLIVWKRIQPSEDGKYHLCLRTYDADERGIHESSRRGAAYCFFAPPNS
jgi:hypothetical protein